jgi:hypothetical protein
MSLQDKDVRAGIFLLSLSWCWRHLPFTSTGSVQVQPDISMSGTLRTENNPFRTWVIFCEVGMEIPDANVLDLNLMLKTPFFLRVKAFQCLITTQPR